MAEKERRSTPFKRSAHHNSSSPPPPSLYFILFDLFNFHLRSLEFFFSTSSPPPPRFFLSLGSSDAKNMSLHLSPLRDLPTLHTFPQCQGSDVSLYLQKKKHFLCQDDRSFPIKKRGERHEKIYSMKNNGVTSPPPSPPPKEKLCVFMALLRPKQVWW